MEKISGILPKSSRVASVDLKESSPVRPGTPTFGRTEGVSSLREAQIGQTASRAAKLSATQLDWRAKDMQNAASVREISDRFFQGNQRAADTADSAIDSVPGSGDLRAGLNVDPLTSARPSQASGLDLDMVASSLKPTIGPSVSDSEAQPGGLYPRGSFVDVVA